MSWGLRDFIFDLYHSFLNLVFDKKCLSCMCSKTDDLLCKTCAKDIEFLSSFPHRIYENIPVYSSCLYKSVIKDLIIKLKFKHKKLASKVLARVLFDYFSKIKEDKNYIICYVPSYFMKSAQRGYNHAYLIAKEFSMLSDLEIYKDLIKKTKYTKPQYKSKDRHSNIKGSFKIDCNSDLSNKTIIVIDDITTSGATLEEIIRCFKEQNIDNLICLTVAKAG